MAHFFSLLSHPSHTARTYAMINLCAFALLFAKREYNGHQKWNKALELNFRRHSGTRGTTRNFTYLRNGARIIKL